MLINQCFASSTRILGLVQKSIVEVDGDVPFFRASFSSIISRAGYQRKDVFLELVVKKAHFR